MAKPKYSPEEAELLHRLREILANAGGIPLSISGMRDQIPTRISTPDVLDMLDHLCALGEVRRHEIKGQRATYATLQADSKRVISAPPAAREIPAPAPAPLPKAVRSPQPTPPEAVRPAASKELPQAQINILRVISSKPMSGNQIADVIDMAQPKVSSHLRKMVAAGLVQSSGRGSKIKFSPTGAERLPATEPQPPLQKQAEMLIEPALDLIRQILIRHQTAVLEEMRDALHKLRASPQ